MEKTYAKVIDSLIRTRGMGEAEVYKRLHAHLTETGRLKLLPQILRELKVLEKRTGDRAPMLEVARKEDAKAAEDAVKKEGITAKAVVNPNLVSGWRLVTNDTLIDRSGKTALIDLYRKITH